MFGILEADVMMSYSEEAHGSNYCEAGRLYEISGCTEQYTTMQAADFQKS